MRIDKEHAFHFQKNTSRIFLLNGKKTLKFFACIYKQAFALKTS